VLRNPENFRRTILTQTMIDGLKLGNPIDFLVRGVDKPTPHINCFRKKTGKVS
jgi:hypothetical protein